MPHKIKITESSENDLVSIFEYVESNDSYGHADELLGNLEKLILSLDELPSRGHIVKELSSLNFDNYREVNFKPYRVIYEVTQDTVIVLAVIDGRRDLEEFLIQRIFQ